MLLSASGLLSTFSPHSHEATSKQLSSQLLLLLSCPSEKNYEEKKQNICISEYSTNAQEILQQPLQAIIQMQSGTAPPLRQLSAQMLGTCLSTPAGSTVYWDIGTSGKWKENVPNPFWIWKASSETNKYYPRKLNNTVTFLLGKYILF